MNTGYLQVARFNYTTHQHNRTRLSLQLQYTQNSWFINILLNLFSRYPTTYARVFPKVKLAHESLRLFSSVEASHQVVCTRCHWHGVQPLWGSRFTIASYYAGLKTLNAVAIFSPFNMYTRAPSSSNDVFLYYWELWFGIMRYYKASPPSDTYI